MRSMEIQPKGGTTVVLHDVPAGSAYWLNKETVGDLAEHPDVVAAFDAGAKSVLVVGPDFEVAQAKERERVSDLLKREAENGVFSGEPPTVDEVLALAQRLRRDA